MAMECTSSGTLSPESSRSRRDCCFVVSWVRRMKIATAATVPTSEGRPLGTGPWAEHPRHRGVQLGMERRPERISHGRVPNRHRVPVVGTGKPRGRSHPLRRDLDSRDDSDVAGLRGVPPASARVRKECGLHGRPRGTAAELARKLGLMRTVRDGTPEGRPRTASSPGKAPSSSCGSARWGGSVPRRRTESPRGSVSRLPGRQSLPGQC